MLFLFYLLQCLDPDPGFDSGSVSARSGREKGITNKDLDCLLQGQDSILFKNMIFILGGVVWKT